MEMTLTLPPPAIRGRTKSHHFSLRIPEADFKSIEELSIERGENISTTTIVLLRAAVAALPKKETSGEAGVEMARVEGAREALNLASRMVREHAQIEREASGSSEAARFAERLEELAAYIEANKDPEGEGYAALS